MSRVEFSQREMRRTGAAAQSAAAAPRTETIVAVERLTKTFRDFWMRERVRAVSDVSFEIYRGEIFGLLGPNGSGKSTTIKILLGLLNKTSGLVSVFGKLPTDVGVKERIGYLPEESYLYPFLNARETLDYYAKLFELERSTRKRRIDELLEMVGLEAVQYRPVREYSKGMQRRIGIAQALINDPELLILDEPTTGLDPIGTRQVKDLILQLGRRGKTVLLSSHLLADVEDCVDRMVILYGGKIRAEGTCDELLEARDRTVIEADALDEGTISQIDAVIRQRSGGERAISRVSRPRQRLEELFIDIVERARAENIETAGARHGGETAAFLREGDGGRPEGEALVESLVAAGDEPRPAEKRREGAGGAEDRSAGVSKDGVDLLKVSSLIAAADAPGPEPTADTGRGGSNVEPPKRVASAPASPPAPSPPRQEADLGVIGSLLDPEEHPDTKRAGEGESERRA